MRRLFVAGNWKMNTTGESASQLASVLAGQLSDELDQVDVLICPPFPYLSAVAAAVSTSRIDVGAQNSYFEAPGAFTGETANEMLLDVGCQWVILGHSERRHVIGETDEIINRKVAASLQKGLRVILCVGEQLSEREADQTKTVLDRQMTGGLVGIAMDSIQDLVIAYEPVWAIGTGKTATEEQAESAHHHLRKWLASRYNSEVADATRILYGGSVKPENALILMSQPNVDGALVGGASLKAELFLAIIRASVDAGHSKLIVKT